MHSLHLHNFSQWKLAQKIFATRWCGRRVQRGVWTAFVLKQIFFDDYLPTLELNEHFAVADCVFNPFNGAGWQAGEDWWLAGFLAVVFVILEAIQKPSVVDVRIAVKCSTFVVLKWDLKIRVDWLMQGAVGMKRRRLWTIYWLFPGFWTAFRQIFK